MATPDTEQITISIKSFVDHAEQRWIHQTMKPAEIVHLVEDDTQRVLALVKEALPEKMQAQVQRLFNLRNIIIDHALPDRYYVHLIGNTFAVREHKHKDALFTEEGRIVRGDFFNRESAQTFSTTLNAIQRQLDVQYGYWVKQADAVEKKNG